MADRLPPTLEIRLPISYRPAWLTRTRLIIAGIRRFYPDAIFRISVGEPTGVSLDFPTIPGVTWHHLPTSEFNQWAGTRAEHLAVMMDRYEPPFRGDWLLFLDADVIPVGRFDELFEYDAIQGVQAHHSPYGVAGWMRLFQDFGLPAPHMIHEYSAYGIMERNPAERLGPAYPNSGVVFGPRHLFERLAQPFADAIDFLRGMVADAYWFDQVGFALGVALSGAAYRSLPLRFNFPNRPAFDAARPAELADVRFLHAMQTDIVHRDRDFEDLHALERLIARRDLTGSNEVLRAAVARLLPTAFPEPVGLSCVEDAPWA